MKPHTKPVGAVATVTLTIEVEAQGSWGPDCSLQQIHDQAGRGAKQYLRSKLGNDRLVRFVGEPEIKTVITERK